MTPRQADPQIRAALLETAAQLLAEGGPDLLTLRRLTSQVGTSTMAVYTHFGSMDVLVSEVAVEPSPGSGGVSTRWWPPTIR